MEREAWVVHINALVNTSKPLPVSVNELIVKVSLFSVMIIVIIIPLSFYPPGVF